MQTERNYMLKPRAEHPGSQGKKGTLGLSTETKNNVIQVSMPLQQASKFSLNLKKNNNNQLHESLCKIK